MSASALIEAGAQQRTVARPASVRDKRHLLLCLALSPVTLLVHGYHPYAEDGGIYLAGIKHLLNPHLFAHGAGFATAHLHLSIFAYVVAAMARHVPLQLMSLLLLLHLVLTFWLLFAAASVARQMTPDVSAQRWATVLLAASLTVPVAGTSLMMMDPYVTARSAAMPCVLAAIAATLRAVSQRSGRAAGTMVALLLVSALLHPLYGVYGAFVVAAIAVCALKPLRAQLGAVAALTLCAAGACFVTQHLLAHVPAGYSVAAKTRTYWILKNWAWYEQAGLLFPLLITCWFARRSESSETTRLFARSLVVAGAIATAVSLLFVHASDTSFAIAKVQPLRVFQFLYYALPLFLGIAMAQRLRPVLFRALLCASVAACLFVSQRSIYSNTAHVESPWAQPSNAWQQAFVWIRNNTPQDAVIATDAQYIHLPAEDAQSLRAISERNAPADASKDGGIAAIQPNLTTAWMEGVALQRDLATVDDAERIRRLRARNIQWLVLPASSATSLPCPYRNEHVRVCHVIS